ncbi:SIR2 family protein [Sorangium sp. So ce291]|uniref:SIR2 family protein n=1 Tax=Sorangium sp. So ce291 TaxID=3133294 RepID=UPI003F5DAC3A
MEIGFEDILPYLASAYRRGVLAPFIGSGMSRPACTSWLDLLRGLADAAGVDVPGHLRKAGTDARLDTSELYRLADKAVLGLASLDAEERADAYRKALSQGGKPPGACDVPAQTAALARCYWPLVLTTNYDDLYVVSRIRQSRAGEMAGVSRTGTPSREARRDETDVPEVLGRSVEDCHKVLRSLESPTRPILWALQGFLGGQAARLDVLDEELVLDARRRAELAGQVVAGYQQYQHAVNAQPHFRRAFAEVLSRRSLLFLGSGILEDYLINLFGEIAHHYGPGPHPHFALFSADRRETLDVRFLQTRLGIAPVFYKDYSELPELIGRLTDAVWERRAPATSGSAPATSGATEAPSGAVKAPVAWMPDELGFSLSNGATCPPGGARRLRLRYAPLSVPAAGDGRACVVVSVGRNPSDNRPIPGTQANGFLAMAREAGLVADTAPERWRPLDGAPDHYAYRFGDAPVLGVAARDRGPEPPRAPGDDGPADSRDLGVIADAVCATLRAADAAGFRHVHLGPVASGQHRLWHPLHPFVQTLAGVRQFFRGTPEPGIELLELHVLSPAIWSPVVAGKVPVAEMLSSGMMKIWVDIRDATGSSEIFAVTVCGPTRVGDIKELCGLPPGRWSTEILPRPSKVEPSSADHLLVTPTSIVVFSPRR